MYVGSLYTVVRILNFVTILGKFERGKATCNIEDSLIRLAEKFLDHLPFVLRPLIELFENVTTL